MGTTVSLLAPEAETLLRVRRVHRETQEIATYELCAEDGSELPPFTAGAHIDLHLPNGLVRSYSLCGDEAERDRYIIGVARSPDSRGGSTWIHDNLRTGDVVSISHPRNNFPLVDADRTILIAGGIGITPLLSMIRRLTAIGNDWTLHYAVRSHAHAAFSSDLRHLAGDRPERLQLHCDDESGSVLDLRGVVQRWTDTGADGVHMYCCGPGPMLTAFEAATAALPSNQRHIEYFTNATAAAKAGGFEVELAASGKTLMVPPGASILETLRNAGIDCMSSCTEGICGACETRVLGGEPDHRDVVLTDDERISNEVMMICCSGSKSRKLILDL
ncbi:PDR/VanB family oxidoreductase [Nocardia pseudovaccinii]|uniref:PDR/VanB family oxidoreductase n=1 Tax=Nocardia pseudovaccinii TaxID=189540 RepID=UPI0007A3966A|nr:PDR/VanB family oxidoreductase [Nocardia pseudovaccinii]